MKNKIIGMVMVLIIILIAFYSNLKGCNNSIIRMPDGHQYLEVRTYGNNGVSIVHLEGCDHIKHK